MCNNCLTQWLEGSGVQGYIQKVAKTFKSEKGKEEIKRYRDREGLESKHSSTIQSQCIIVVSSGRKIDYSHESKLSTSHISSRVCKALVRHGTPLSIQEDVEDTMVAAVTTPQRSWMSPLAGPLGKRKREGRLKSSK